ncbi:unnamed protein product, partial [Didymodactylos carnosus]
MAQISPSTRRHSIHPTESSITSSQQHQLLPQKIETSVTRSGSMQSLSHRDETPDRYQSREIIDTTGNKSGLLAKLTDAKRTLFGRSQIPEAFFNSHVQNKAILSYILSEPQPQLNIIQEFEKNGSQLNAITEDGNNPLHLLACADSQSSELINI